MDLKVDQGPMGATGPTWMHFGPPVVSKLSSCEKALDFAFGESALGVKCLFFWH